MSSGKISSLLSESLRGADSDALVDVVIELDEAAAMDHAGASRTEKIAARKAAFNETAAPMTDRIRRLGGEVIGQAWINHVIRARVPKKVIPSLSEELGVKRLDSPRALAPDAG